MADPEELYRQALTPDAELAQHVERVLAEADWLECCHCNERKPDVVLRVDPVMAEVWDDDTESPICDACCSDRADEV